MVERKSSAREKVTGMEMKTGTPYPLLITNSKLKRLMGKDGLAI